MHLLVRFVVFNVALIGLLFSERLIQAAELVFAAEGKSAYQIVVPDSLPTPSLDESLRQTARLMQFAFQANGCEIAVVTEAKREALRPGIFLGDAPAAGSFWRGNIGHTRVAAADRVEHSLWSASSSTKVMDDRNDFGEFVFEAPRAENASSDRDAILLRMRALHQDRKWKELIEQFASEDFSTWPADMQNKAGEAFHLRGQIYSFLKDGPKAEADLKASVKLAPKNAAFWLTLADNYTNNRQDDEQALVAYRQAFSITGKGNGWQPLTATIAIARLLTDQVKTDEAVAVLKQYGDMEGMAPVWKIKMLRAYGHAYAAQGNEKESLAKFREALELESKP